jgi:serine/threonine-protein kinase RsbT
MEKIDLLFEALSFEVAEPSDNAKVVFGARKILARMGFNETSQYLIASAVSELSTNILRYANQGTVSLRIIHDGDKKGLEIIALDQGPGIEHISQALKENYSTGKGLGLGLPSVKRIMDEFDIRSAPGMGTRIMAIKWMN